MDERLNNGPLQNRSCTDVLCTLLFILFFGAFILVSIFGLKNGDPKTLFAPLDSDGKFCGVSAGYEDFKLLHYQNQQANDWLMYATCVSKCPTTSDADVLCKTT